MQDIKIALFDAKPYDLKYFDKANKEYKFNINYIKSHLNEETVKLAEGSNVICAFANDTLSGEVIKSLLQNKVELIALRSAGYNNVDFKAAYKKIHVVRVPEYSPYAVAEHAMALILSLNRKIHKAYYRTRDGNFNINGLIGFDLNRKTAGIIGTGKIGRVLIRILKGFGMDVIAYDKFPDEKVADEMGYNYVKLDTLFKKSDIISLHCPLTSETYHLINEDNIKIMKNGVYIINTGRGQLIDSKALIKALKDKKIGAAGLDVYEEESDYFFEDFSAEILDDDVLARLLTFNNVLITSHQGFFTKEAMKNIALTTLENIKEFFSGQNLTNEICYKCTREGGVCRNKKEGKCF